MYDSIISFISESVKIRFYKFRPWQSVRQNPVLQIPRFSLGPSNSSPAISSPANSASPPGHPRLAIHRSTTARSGPARSTRGSPDSTLAVMAPVPTSDVRAGALARRPADDLTVTAQCWQLPGYHRRLHRHRLHLQLGARNEGGWSQPNGLTTRI
jgi:hypothetical protein